jgi:hypothetical protein
MVVGLTSQASHARLRLVCVRAHMRVETSPPCCDFMYVCIIICVCMLCMFCVCVCVWSVSDASDCEGVCVLASVMRPLQQVVPFVCMCHVTVRRFFADGWQTESTHMLLILTSNHRRHVFRKRLSCKNLFFLCFEVPRDISSFKAAFGVGNQEIMLTSRIDLNAPQANSRHSL